MKTFIEYVASKENKSVTKAFDWLAEAINPTFRGFQRGGDDIAEKMKAEFGQAPYYVDPHLIDMMIKSRTSPMSMDDIKNKIIGRYGLQIFAAMQDFIRSGGKTDLRSQQDSDANDFASGGGGFR